MALEQFKTQVLLLHSQQSTLDTLSAGFGDRYAVHLATSGAEALTTLGETPIHVIVSAQDLPGMSGLEALREARKRSPDTVGILLAGDGDDGLEALVGEEEVFQVVRGTVTAEALLELVESATRRIRMLTISESANDQAANVDEPVAEHIIMETSEHGTSIITDGTARLRALRARQPPVAGHPGGRDVDVLVLTKDEEFLATILDSTSGLHEVRHAHTPAQAEALVREHKVGVLVTDAAMAASEMESITQQLRKAVPRLVAIVAGRRDDGELLMDLINRGQVYRFLLKPVSPGRARLAIEASVKRYLETDDAGAKGKPAPQAAPPRAKAPPREKRPARPQAPAPAPENKVEAKAADSVRPAPADGPRKDEPPGASGRLRKTGTGLVDTASVPGSAASAGGSRKPLLLAGGGVALVVAAGVAWWLTSAQPPAEPGQSGSAAVAEPSPSVVESDVPLAPRRPAAQTGRSQSVPAYQPFLDEARAARDAGEIVMPPGNNALELYVAALEIAPENAEISGELEAVVEQAIGIAETALLERRDQEAAQAVELVRLARPDNPRLPFLSAQVAERQLRARLEQARLAIREQRLEDAAQALAAAEEVAGAETTELELLRDELATARGQQELDEVLSLASERLAAGSLTVPTNDNARYYYQLALSTDPDNAVARQGLSLVAGRLVLRAREAIDSGALDRAQRMLSDAAALDASSGELAAALEALAAAQAQADTERLAEEARQAEAEREAALEAERQAALEGDGATLSRNEASGARTEGTAAAEPGSSAEPEYVPISSLTRTNYVAPRYPRAAQRRNITGWADVSFRVTTEGRVAEVEVLSSSPGDVFDAAAMEAISEWRFEPSLENGMPTERRVAVRLSFDLE